MTSWPWFGSSLESRLTGRSDGFGVKKIRLIPWELANWGSWNRSLPCKMFSTQIVWETSLFALVRHSGACAVCLNVHGWRLIRAWEVALISVVLRSRWTKMKRKRRDFQRKRFDLPMFMSDLRRVNSGGSDPPAAQWHPCHDSQRVSDFQDGNLW